VVPAAEAPPRAVAGARVGERLAAVALFGAMLLAYNANGREIPSYDSRPTAFAARELLLRKSLSLNYVVGATPEYAARWGYILAADGRYRSVYSPVPALAAATLTWPAWRAGLLDIRAPRAPQLMAKATASTLVALAVVFAYLTARQFGSRRAALVVAAGLGLGTGYWSAASQTLWQMECTVLGFSMATWALARANAGALRTGLWIGAGLALAASARPQTALAAVVLLAAAWQRDRRTGLTAAALVAAAGGTLMVFNIRWFGHAMGALPLLTGLNAQIHATGPTFAPGLEGAAGLLVSPSRGLFVFSPIVIVALAGLARGRRAPNAAVAWWCAGAAAVQFTLYASFAVWWGGHTYGPRYTLDLLPLLVPGAALAGTVAWPRAWTALAAAALVWSVAVAAIGAFCYPNDRWNSAPTDIDRDHARLWAVPDNQIVRCWRAGASPQNYSLFTPLAFRVTPP
jgi:hypothetical protein